MLIEYKINEYSNEELKSVDILINEEYVGFLQYVVRNDGIYIHEIEIEFNYRGRGIARKVIYDLASTYKIYTLYGLAVPEAKGFWKKLGAEIEEGEGERKFIINSLCKIIN